MANQIEHILPRPAIEPFRGSPLTLLRAQVLAAATVNLQTAIALVRFRSTEISRTLSWLESSYLMRKVLGGWRLTATGELALRDSFRAVCEGWLVCGQCSRMQPPGAFLGKKGKPVKYCAGCRERGALWDTRRGS